MFNLLVHINFSTSQNFYSFYYFIICLSSGVGMMNYGEGILIKSIFDCKIS